jgi:membrane associated rhomboid family serine protease
LFVPIGTEEPQPRRSLPVVTLGLVGLNVLVFVIELVVLAQGGDTSLGKFMTRYGTVPDQVSSGRDLYSLVTSMFVHASVAHIAFNMAYLLPFGDNVEDRLGHVGYLVFYLFVGVAASLAQVAIDPSSDVPGVGASGAIAGVLAAYVLFFPQGIVRIFLFLWVWATIGRFPALFFIGFWFLVQFLSGIGSLGAETTATGGTAYWAHIGGFVVGLVVAGLVVLLGGRARPERKPGAAPW